MRAPQRGLTGQMWQPNNAPEHRALHNAHSHFALHTAHCIFYNSIRLHRTFPPFVHCDVHYHTVQVYIVQPGKHNQYRTEMQLFEHCPLPLPLDWVQCRRNPSNVQLQNKHCFTHTSKGLQSATDICTLYNMCTTTNREDPAMNTIRPTLSKCTCQSAPFSP